MTHFALLGFPLFALLLFAKLGRERGLIWTVVLGYLFLPENISYNIPLLPDYNKIMAVAVAVLLGAFLYGAPPQPGLRDLRPRNPQGPAEDPRIRFLILGLLALFCLTTLLIVQTNKGALVNGDVVRPGLRLPEVMGLIVRPLTSAVPFFLAWRWLHTREHHMALLQAVVLVGLFYSVLALYEIRFSPQINRMVYGYFPHSWLQHIRGGSFRPVIFLQHGLWLGFFQFTATVSAFAMARMAGNVWKIFYFGAGVWLMAVLLVSSNLGAALLTFLFVPMIFLPRKLQAWAALGVALIFLAYPAVRQANLVPNEAFLSQIAKLSTERAASLRFRLENEDTMLARAAEKPLFGWGHWGRWRVYNEEGQDLTVSDGLWIIMLGERGWTGYIGFFGLLTLPTLLLCLGRRRPDLSVAATAMALVGAGNLIYLVPNSALSPIGWLMAGAVAGLVGFRPVVETPETVAEAPAAEDDRKPRYSRFRPGQAAVVVDRAPERSDAGRPKPDGPRLSRFSKG